MYSKIFVVSGIYAPAKNHGNDAFWAHLLELNSIIDCPWCLIGDFNDIEDFSEKKGGIAPSPSRLRRLQPF